MTGIKPPVAATWLLKYFGCSPNNDAVIGDLAEGFQARQSPSWYWRQVFIAILQSAWKEVWSHKRTAISSLVVGWAAWCPLAFFNDRLSLLIAPFNWTYPQTYPLALILTYLPFATGCGWLVGRVALASRRAMVLLYAASWWTIHTVLLAQMASTRFQYTWISMERVVPFDLQSISYQAQMILTRMIADLILVSAIVFGGTWRRKHLSLGKQG